MGLKLFYLLLVFGLFYKNTFSAPLAKLADNDNDVADTSNEEEEEDEAEDAESGDDGSGSKKDEIETEDDDGDSNDDEGSKRDDITDNEDSDDNGDDSDKETETASEESEDKSNVEEDNEDSDEAAKKEEVPAANEEEEEEEEDSDDANDSEDEDDGAEKRSSLNKRYYDHHDHEGKEHGHHHEHEHGHHEHEHEHHHHGHHHGFIHEWGQEEGGEHHGHEGQGHHEHHHHHDHEHDHHHGHHHEHEHHKHHGEEDGYGWGRSNTPLAYHCRDMVSRTGNNKAATKRFCVPIGYRSNYGIQYFHSFPGNTGAISNNLRSSIAHASPEDTRKMNQVTRDHDSKVTKKQTVHVGYGYASGDNYRLGYQQGGMGGLASSFSGGSVGADHGPENFDGPEQMKKSSLPFPSTHDVQATKRHFPGNQGGFSPFTHGSATPYGHPVTHPGFTTMGYPGHALASPDVRNKIDHPKVKRQIFNPEQFAAQQQPPQLSGAMSNMMEGAPQMDPQGSPVFPNMLGQSPEPMGAPMGLSQEDIGGTMRSMMPRYPGDAGQQFPPQLAGYNAFRGRRYVSVTPEDEE